MSDKDTLVKRARGALFPPPIKPDDRYQVQAIKAIIDSILDGLNGLVIQPTATGKSTEAAFVARSCILIHGMRGIYLYDENDGLHQARKSFEYIFSKNKIKCANFFGFKRDDDVTEADLVFASFQSMNSHHQQWYKMFDQNHFDFMIVNEAHHGQAVTYRPVIEHFNCPHIGMTGTPERMDGQNILEIFDRILVNIPFEKALVSGWISPVEYHVLGHNLSTKKLKEITREYVEEGKKVSIKQINESIFIDELDREMLNEVYKFSFPDNEANRQTKIFCENIEHANRIVAQIKSDGHNAEVAHSKMGHVHNTNSLEGFRQSKTQFLVSVDKYNEDIDIPSIEVVVFFRTTDSKTVFLQQLGRGLRKGKPKLYVLDFVGNAERMLILRKLEKDIAEYTEKEEAFDKHRINITSLGFQLKWHGYSPDVLKIIEAIQLGKYETWQEASEAAIGLGITGQISYNKGHKKDLRLPSNPYKYADFPGFPIFLGGQEKDLYPTYKEAKDAIDILSITCFSEYQLRRQEDPRLPAAPYVIYKNKGWENWPNYFGKEDFYQTYEEAKTAVMKLNIKSGKEYEKGRYKEDPKLPAAPFRVYIEKGWINWKAFLGSSDGKTYSTYAEAENAVQKLNIKSSTEYRKRFKEDPKLPSLPEDTYKSKGWINFPKFLGKNDRSDYYQTYEEAKTAVMKLNIKSGKEYEKGRYKEDPKLPATPFRVYRGRGWIDWQTFLENKEK